MKKLLGILVLGFLWCNLSFAETNKNTVEVIFCYNRNWQLPVIFAYKDTPKCYEGLYDQLSYRNFTNPWNIICYNPNGKPDVSWPPNVLNNFLGKNQKFIHGTDCKKLSEPWKILKHISTEGNIEKFSY